MSITNNNQSGFTLIELVLAMTLFAFVLLIMSSGFLNIMAQSENGIVTRNTQQNARLAMEEIQRVGHSATNVIVGSSALVVGGTSITYSTICFTGADNPVIFYVDHPLVSSIPQLMEGTFNANVSVATTTDCVPTATNFEATSQQLTSIDSPLVADLAAPGLIANVVGEVDALDSSNNVIYATASSVQITLKLASTGFVGSSSCNGSVHGLQYCSVTTLHTSVTTRGVR